MDDQYLGQVQKPAERIGARIKAHRKRLGFSQEALARAAGVTSQSVSNWERGNSAPELDTLELLTTILGVSLSALIDRPTPGFAEDSVVFSRPGRLILADFLEEFEQPVKRMNELLALGKLNLLGGK